jgi:hypothetical protein
MSRIKALPVGSRFGCLTVVSFAGIGQRSHAQWNCKCDCGKETVVLGTHLRRGKTRSCGHLFTTVGTRAPNFINLAGKKFDKWQVLDRYEVRTRRNGKKAAYWLCRCDCGLEKFVSSGQLNYGTTTRCKFCAVHKLPFGESARRTVLQSYKDEAAERNLSWSLTDSFFDEITKRDCFYCGLPPSNYRKSSDSFGGFTFSGIDRVDNSRGYELDNVVPCCRRCNRAKDVMSQQDFISWAKRIVAHLETKK